MNQDLLNQPETDGTPPTAAPRDRQQRAEPSRKPGRGDAEPEHVRTEARRGSVDPMRATDRYRLARPLL